MGKDKGVKHVVKVQPSIGRVSLDKERVEALKGVVGGKMLARMKKESVECPVTLNVKPFVECFLCPNFIRRIKGEVHCLGLNLTRQ
ncbi:hypothetical protein KEJ51_03210 [Candidatus Bathyarchaeota archaeon]|nr:hypothetical protein [Candidatus Bathyarchaeota archaeon]